MNATMTRTVPRPPSSNAYRSERGGFRRTYVFTWAARSTRIARIQQGEFACPISIRSAALSILLRLSARDVITMEIRASSPVIVPPAGTCALRAREKPDLHVSHGPAQASAWPLKASSGFRPRTRPRLTPRNTSSAFCGRARNLP